MVFPSKSLAILLAVVGFPTVAQDASPFRASFKVGATPVLGIAGEQAAKGGALLGVEYALGADNHAFFLGLDYRVFSAVQRDRTRYGRGYGTDGTPGQIAASGPDEDGNIVSTGEYDSADLRTNKLEGLSLRGGYRHSLSDKWQVHGGVNLSFLRSVQEVTGVINVVRNRQSNPVETLGTENLYMDVHASKPRLGLFAGARYRMDDSLFVEINLSNLGYQEVDYVPFSYTGKAPSSNYVNRSKTTFEFNLGLAF